jgi:hypothetical protein
MVEAAKKAAAADLLTCLPLSFRNKGKRGQKRQ